MSKRVTTNGKSKSNGRLETREELAVASARARSSIDCRHATAMARIGIEPTKEQYTAAEADPATEWLLVVAVAVRDEIRRNAVSSPDYVRRRFPSPLQVDNAIAARVAYLCDGLTL